MKIAQGMLMALLVTVVAAPLGAATLNEVVANDVSTDDSEYVEICGLPGESLNGIWLVIIEGEPSSTGGQGLIDQAIDLTGYVIPADGFFVIGDAVLSPDLTLAANWIENGAETILLVQDFSSSQNTDVDADDDCVADFSIGTIVDGLSLVGTGSSTLGPDCAYYGVPVLGPDTTYDPAGAARCGDCDGSWGMICLSGTEPAPAGSACAVPHYVVEFATPGAENCPIVPVEAFPWSKVKSLYR